MNLYTNEFRLEVAFSADGCIDLNYGRATLLQLKINGSIRRGGNYPGTLSGFVTARSPMFPELQVIRETNEPVR